MTDNTETQPQPTTEADMLWREARGYRDNTLKQLVFIGGGTIVLSTSLLSPIITLYGSVIHAWLLLIAWILCGFVIIYGLSTRAHHSNYVLTLGNVEASGNNATDEKESDEYHLTTKRMAIVAWGSYMLSLLSLLVFVCLNLLFRSPAPEVVNMTPTP